MDAEPTGGSWLDHTVENLRIAADVSFAAVVVYFTAPISIPLGLGYATLEAS